MIITQIWRVQIQDLALVSDPEGMLMIETPHSKLKNSSPANRYTMASFSRQRWVRLVRVFVLLIMFVLGSV